VVLLDLKSSILREISTCHGGPKAVLFHLAIFLLEALVIYTSFEIVADAVYMSDLR
jgi:hypothetical protein